MRCRNPFVNQVFVVPDIMSLEKVNGPKSYVADQLPRPVERRIVMDNEKVSGAGTASAGLPG